MLLRYCMSCGERKRLRWPKRSPTCCSQSCAADAFTQYAEASDEWDAAYCNGCGAAQMYCGCDDPTPNDDEE